MQQLGRELPLKPRRRRRRSADNNGSFRGVTGGSAPRRSVASHFILSQLQRPDQVRNWLFGYKWLQAGESDRENDGIK